MPADPMHVEEPVAVPGGEPLGESELSSMPFPGWLDASRHVELAECRHLLVDAGQDSGQVGTLGLPDRPGEDAVELGGSR